MIAMTNSNRVTRRHFPVVVPSEILVIGAVPRLVSRVIHFKRAHLSIRFDWSIPLFEMKPACVWMALYRAMLQWFILRCKAQ